MRAYREETPVRQQSSGTYPALIGCAVLVIAALAYFALRAAATSESATETPLAVASEAQVDAASAEEGNSGGALSAAASAPAATTPAGDTASTTAGVVATSNFGARELAPPRVTVGVGEAPVVPREGNEAFVINGELLEELEANAPPVIQ